MMKVTFSLLAIAMFALVGVASAQELALDAVPETAMMNATTGNATAAESDAGIAAPPRTPPRTHTRTPPRSQRNSEKPVLMPL